MSTLSRIMGARANQRLASSIWCHEDSLTIGCQIEVKVELFFRMRRALYRGKAVVAASHASSMTQLPR